MNTREKVVYTNVFDTLFDNVVYTVHKWRRKKFDVVLLLIAPKQFIQTIERLNSVSDNSG